MLAQGIGASKRASVPGSQVAFCYPGFREVIARMGPHHVVLVNDTGAVSESPRVINGVALAGARAGTRYVAFARVGECRRALPPRFSRAHLPPRDRCAALLTQVLEAADLGDLEYCASQDTLRQHPSRQV